MNFAFVDYDKEEQSTQHKFKSITQTHYTYKRNFNFTQESFCSGLKSHDANNFFCIFAKDFLEWETSKNKFSYHLVCTNH